MWEAGIAFVKANGMGVLRGIELAQGAYYEALAEALPEVKSHRSRTTPIVVRPLTHELAYFQIWPTGEQRQSFEWAVPGGPIVVRNADYRPRASPTEPQRNSPP
jgi:hypothetical protein